MKTIKFFGKRRLLFPTLVYLLEPFHHISFKQKWISIKSLEWYVTNKSLMINYWLFIVYHLVYIFNIIFWIYTNYFELFYHIVPTRTEKIQIDHAKTVSEITSHIGTSTKIKPYHSTYNWILFRIGWFRVPDDTPPRWYGGYRFGGIF